MPGRSEERLFAEALSCLQQSDYPSAEFLFRKFLQEAPADNDKQAEALFHLGFCLELQKRFKEAETFYTKANSYPSPGIQGNALFRIAWMAMILKAHHKALIFYQKAHETFRTMTEPPDMHKDCIYQLALSLEGLNRVILALASYREIENDPNWFWDVCFRKIKCYDKLGRYPEMLDCCREFEDRFQAQPGAKRAGELYPMVKSTKRQLLKLL